MPVRVFISYAHEDRAWCERLLDHPEPLYRASTADRFGRNIGRDKVHWR